MDIQPKITMQRLALHPSVPMLVSSCRQASYSNVEGLIAHLGRCHVLHSWASRPSCCAWLCLCKCVLCVLLCCTPEHVVLSDELAIEYYLHALWAPGFEHRARSLQSIHKVRWASADARWRRAAGTTRTADCRVVLNRAMICAAKAHLCSATGCGRQV